MAPVATQTSEQKTQNANGQNLKSTQPINPFYSPSNGDSGDDAEYEYVRYKVRK